MEERPDAALSGSTGNNSAVENESPPAPQAAALTAGSEGATERTLAPETTAAAATTTTTASATPGGIAISGGESLYGKKKRGRPRKYDAAGNLILSPHHSSSASSSSFLADHQQQQLSRRSGRGGRGSRARLRGSAGGSWQLLASLGGLFASTAGGDFTPHVVTINAGEDVAGKIMALAQMGAPVRGICVLSANGAVSNVTIRQPGSSSGGLLTYEGRFEILSLSGSFTVTDHGGVRSRTGGLSVSLAGPDGRVIGGSIAGALVAASPIQIVVGSFMPNGYKPQKRKYVRRQHAATPASVATSNEDTVHAATPISQAKPDHGGIISFGLPSSHQAESDRKTLNDDAEDETPNEDSPDSGEWDDPEEASDHQRPSPDINVSVPCD